MPSRTTLYCPSCQSKNIYNKLNLHQISLTTAVYICEDKTCSYPKGYDWIEVSRSLDELLFEKQQTTGDSDLDNWLDQAFERETNNVKSVTCKNITTEYNSDDFLAEIFKELDNGGNNTINNEGTSYIIKEPSVDSQTITKTQDNSGNSSCNYLDNFFGLENENFVIK